MNYIDSIQNEQSDIQQAIMASLEPENIQN